MKTKIKFLITLLKCYKVLTPFFKYYFLYKISKKQQIETLNQVKNNSSIEEKDLFINEKSLKHYKEKGYWELVPKINIESLNSYYSNSYWQEFRSGNISYTVNPRDVDHYNMIINKNKNFNRTKKTIVNFGSGHLGISFLFYYMGHNIINVDLHTPDLKIKSSNFLFKKSLDFIDSKVDLFYSSHSLEHVHDLNYFEKKLNPILNDGGLLFFEVPNSETINFNNGGISGEIIIPHTYYFTKKYFFKLPFKKQILNSFSSISYPNKKNNEGDVLRYLAQKV